MSVAFYMDHHVPSAVTEGLRRREQDVLTAFDDGGAELEDEVILRRATALDRSVFTQDEDFLLAIAAQWQQIGRQFSPELFLAAKGA